MKTVVYPADSFGCGHLRMIWPTEILEAAGHDVQVMRAEEREVELVIEGESVRDVRVDADVVVFQRVTHRWIADCIPILRAKGTAVVVDIDDDLNSIHPANPAWASMHPKNESPRHRHSWRNLTAACQAATLVTVSAPALLDVYARHGRGIVLPNYLPDHYYGVPHEDSNKIGWPASLHSHPDDPSVVGGAVARMVSEGASFRTIGHPEGTGAAFGLDTDPPGQGVPIDVWPGAVAQLGIGIAPLADTKFNRSKSWLKPLEMSALGVPWIASPRAEYERIHALGAGLLVDNPRRWYKALRRLHSNEAARKELSEAGRSVAAGLRLRDHAWKWMDAWQEAYRLQAHS